MLYTDEEWEEYHINCAVNDRGLPIDIEFPSSIIVFHPKTLKG